MKNFIGGFNDRGEPVEITFARMQAAAADWIITPSTPQGPAQLLKAARDMFCLGLYSYELIACSASWSITAVEAALKLRLDAGSKPFQKLVTLAIEQELIDAYLGEVLDAGRQIRNNFVHEGRQPVWTLGMAGSAIGTSFKVVAQLYPAATPDEHIPEP
ncbi:hypothetical protein [Actinoplanes flavus]|uniref:DUF4145 domain-containing protein n=1 Tax=Actinoplanes flavus TaxID=2820290 RepID=A0ABS3UHT8_9ACTN|nr:hypothetical protein [Actinoplanes flavus]MBO3738337.1 hypothetical protein [Actinoplanes flavus]